MVSFCAKPTNQHLVRKVSLPLPALQQHISPKHSQNPNLFIIVENLKTKARELLKRQEVFGKDMQCSVDIEDHKFQ